MIAPAADDARFRLDNRVALVTGAGQGIGRAVAHALSAGGATVVLVDNAQDALSAVEREIADAGGVSYGLCFDVADVAAVDDIVDDVIGRLGRLDILVNNAGMRVHKRVVEHDIDDWEHVFRVNCTAPFAFCRAAAMSMQAGGGGAIVNVASQMALVTSPFRVAYCASKAAIVQMTRVMAVDWAEYRIRVNAIGPGLTLTPFTQSAIATGSMSVRPEAVPLRRMADPQEIADGVRYLVSDAASYITGEFLVVDGGQSVHWRM